MSAGDLVLINAQELPELLRKHRWVPSLATLETVEAGRTQVKVLAVELEADGGANLSSACSIWADVDDLHGDCFAGPITSSRLDRDGFRVGDRLEAPLDRVFDLVVLGATGAPRLNMERARFALGKRILVGLTTRELTGERVEQRQFVGRLVSIDPVRGLKLEVGDGSHEWLPPDVRPLEEAPRGEYRLRSTGEIVEDPDYLCYWTATRSGNSSC
jgi:hypothetical protein